MVVLIGVMIGYLAVVLYWGENLEIILYSVIGALVILTLAIIFELFRQRQAKAKVKKLEQEQSQTQDYYERLEENIKTLENLSIMMQEQGDELQDAIEEYDVMVAEPSESITGKPLLDVVLRRKALSAKEQGISYEEKIQMPQNALEQFDEVRLITLFENLLDNAIEACVEIEQAKIWISMGLRQDICEKSNKNIWYIELINSKTDAVHPLETNFYTTKADKRFHGNGVKIIRDVIESYQGMIAIEDRGDFLVQRIEIPIYI